MILIVRTITITSFFEDSVWPNEEGEFPTLQHIKEAEEDVSNEDISNLLLSQDTKNDQVSYSVQVHDLNQPNLAMNAPRS